MAMLNIGFCPPFATTRYDIKTAGLWYLRIRDRTANDIGWLIIARRGFDNFPAMTEITQPVPERR